MSGIDAFLGDTPVSGVPAENTDNTDKPLDLLADVRKRYPAMRDVEHRLAALARALNEPLDPEEPDGAAIVLRASTLVSEGHGGREALAQAREELLASRPRRRAEAFIDTSSFQIPRLKPVVVNDPQAVVFCATCGSEKLYVARAGYAFPRCGHQPVVLAQPAAEDTSITAGWRTKEDG